jgi:hypothetical protein
MENEHLHLFINIKPTTGLCRNDYQKPEAGEVTKQPVRLITVPAISARSVFKAVIAPISA